LTQKQSEESVSRRSFLRAAVVTAAAASATGAGAALIRSNSQPLSQIPTVPLPPYKNLIANGGDATAELFGQLAALQADNVRLRSRLDALGRQVKSERTGVTAAEQELAVELSAATEQVSILSGLVSLYQQLDEVDLTELLEEGVASVSASIRDLFDAVPSLAEGVEIGQVALDELEQHIPLLREGQFWLEEHLEKLQGSFATVELLLQSAASSAAPFLQLLNEWVQDILKWLPFGLGERASHIFRAIGNLLEETPRTINGLDNNVVQPLDVWLGGEVDEIPLRQQLVKPVRERLIEAARQTVTRAEQVHVAHRNHLVEPALAAVNNRRAVRERIALYRESFQI